MRNINFVIGYLFLAIFLTPVICRGEFSNYVWIVIILSALIPLYLRYSIDTTKTEWFVLTILGYPFLFVLYLLLGATIQNALHIMIIYFICAIIFSLSFNNNNFKKQLGALNNLLHKQNKQQTLIEGHYNIPTSDKSSTMAFSMNGSIIGNATDYSYWLLGNSLFSFEFSINDTNRQLYFKELPPTVRTTRILHRLTKLLNPYKKSYILNIENHRMEISNEGIITFPDNDITKWNWKTNKKTITLQTENNRIINFFLYPEGVLCLINEKVTKDLEISIMSLMFFFRLLLARRIDT